MNINTLQRYRVMTHASPHAISAFAHKNIAQHQIHYANKKTAQFDGNLSHASLGELSLSNLSFGSETLVKGEDWQDSYYIQLVMTGELEVNNRGERYHANKDAIAIVPPYHAVALHHSADCRKLIVRIKKSTLEKHVTQFLGKASHHQVEFSPTVKLNQPRVGSLIRTIKYICDELDDPAASIDNHFFHHSRTTLLLDSLLAAIPHSHSEKIERVIGLEGPELLLRTEQYILNNLEQDIRLCDIVQASGTSERNLYTIFKNHRANTPMGHLKLRRLQMARRALETNAHQTKTITDIAMSVGLSHLGNFAADYKRLYGEVPSETLRRHQKC